MVYNVAELHNPNRYMTPRICIFLVLRLVYVARENDCVYSRKIGWEDEKCSIVMPLVYASYG